MEIDGWKIVTNVLTFFSNVLSMLFNAMPAFYIHGFKFQIPVGENWIGGKLLLKILASLLLPVG